MSGIKVPWFSSLFCVYISRWIIKTGLENNLIHLCVATLFGRRFQQCKNDWRDSELPECLQCGGTLQKARTLPSVQKCVLVHSARHSCFVKDQHVWQVRCFVPISLGNQTQGQLRRIEHLYVRIGGCEMQICRRADNVHPHPSVPSDPLSFASSTRDWVQQRGQHKDKPHRALSLAAGSLWGDAILFLLQQMSVPPPLLQQLTSVCILSFFTRDPFCPGCFLFYIWKSRGTAQSLSYRLQAQHCWAASYFCLRLPKPCTGRADTPLSCHFSRPSCC